MWRHIRRLLGSDEVWLVLAIIATKGLAFIITILITRTQGTSALGLYSATVNVAAFVSNPFVAMLQYNATLLAKSRYKPVERRRFAWAHAPGTIILVGLGLLSFAVLAPQSGLPNIWDDGNGLSWIAAFSVMFYQIVGSVALGALQGVGEFVRPAQWRVAVTAFVVLIAVPAIYWGGLSGAYAVLAINSVVLPLMLVWMYLQPRNSMAGEASASVERLSMRVLTRTYWESSPTVLTAWFSSGVGWFCFIFLVNTWHGSSGLGWVSLAVQWATLMLVPVSGLGGMTLKRLSDAKETGIAKSVRKAIYKEVLQNAAVTVFFVIIIVAASPVLAGIYKVPADTLRTVLIISGACAVVGAVNYVFELLAFCAGKQGSWMVMSMIAGAAQCVVTVVAISFSFLGAPVGMGVGALVLSVGAWTMCRRHFGENLDRSRDGGRPDLASGEALR